MAGGTAAAALIVWIWMRIWRAWLGLLDRWRTGWGSVMRQRLGQRRLRRLRAIELRGLRLRWTRARARAEANRAAALAEEVERLTLALRLAERRQGASAAARPVCFSFPGRRCPWAAVAAEGAGTADARFQAAKRAFALRFHPDRSVGASPQERALRAALFREYWAVLRRIERGGSG